jgi:CHAT domain-containing protein/Tfp pilus assembly protein PilF
VGQIPVFKAHLFVSLIAISIPVSIIGENKASISPSLSKEIASIPYQKKDQSNRYSNNLDYLEAEKLYELAVNLTEQQNYQQAITILQKALKIYISIDNKQGERNTLTKLGNIYQTLKNNIEALSFHKRALQLSREINEPSGILRSLISLGSTHEKLGDYKLAIEYFNEALQLSNKIGTDTEKASLFSNLGQVLTSIGQYEDAIKLHQQAIIIRRQLKEQRREGISLNNLGFAYTKAGQFDKALQAFEESLSIRRAIKDKTGEVNVLNNLADLYYKQKQYQKSLDVLHLALKISREIKFNQIQGQILDGIASAYKELRRYSLAQDFYLESLVIIKSTGEKGKEAIVISNLGDLFARQGKVTTAIAFYKESIQVTESIRKELTTLDIEQQKSYTNTVAYTYRALADLLLSQGRVLEAQQVLELLKIQEIRDFTQNTRAGDTSETTEKNDSEKKLIGFANSLIKLGLEIERCDKENCPQKYLEDLKEQRFRLTQEFNATIDLFKKEADERASKDDGFFEPEKIQGKSGEIFSAQPNTILIYTFVQTDRTWIIWAAKGGIKKPIEIKAGRSQIGKLVLDLRTQLKSSDTDIAKLKETSKQLHDIIIPPELQAELKANKIENLIFSLDSVTRYIPMSVLFDGKQYLLEKYAISNLISADLIDVKDRLPSDTQSIKVIAAGVSQKFEDFAPLLNVPVELDAIVKSSQSASGIFAGKRLLNAEFTSKTLRNNLSGYNILHIATHGKFVPVDANASFLLLGDGTKLIIKDIKNAIDDLYQVHLVVLSACQTALGDKGEDGVEISGLSYYFLNGGAKAVIASLWSVNDDSTSQLMKRFYANLAKGTAQAPMSKIESLRQAQLGLLRSDGSRQESDQRGNFVTVEVRPIENVQPAKKNNFAHPYYWAPFILIGNGL